MRFAPAGLLLSLVLAVPLRAEVVTDPRTGLKIDVRDWKYKWDEKDKCLWIAPPGGMRIKVESETCPSALSKEQVGESYKADGRMLQTRYTDVEPIQKPVQKGQMGPQPAWGYVIRYKPSAEELHHSRTWLATGPAQAADTFLKVKILVFGREQLFETHKEGLKLLLASVRWPPGSTTVATVPGPTTLPGGTGTGTGGTRVVATTPPATKIVDPDTVQIGEGEFSRGSDSGGTDMTNEMVDMSDPELLKRTQAALGSQHHDRTEAEQAEAAARLGFGTGKPAP